MNRLKLLQAAAAKVRWDEADRTLRWKPSPDGRTPVGEEVRSEYLSVSGRHLVLHHVVWYLVTKQVIDQGAVLSRVHGDGGFQHWRVISRRDSIMLGKNPNHRYKYRNWLGALKDSHA